MLNRAILPSLIISVIIYSTVLLANTNTGKVTAAVPLWEYSQIPKKTSLRGAAIKQGSMWVTGTNNTVFVSHDAGKTWIDKSVPAKLTIDFRDIELFDRKTAIVMSIGTGELSKLYKTVDGGNSWQLLYQNKDEKGFFDSIAFWNNKMGLLLGDPVDGYYVIKKTNDGGKTWRRILKNKLPKSIPKESPFAASGNSIIVGQNGKAWIAMGGFSSSIYISNDYGESWQRQPTPLYQETATAGGYSMALNHQEQPFVVGGDYTQRPRTYSNMARLIDGKWQSVNTGNRGLRTAMSCQGDICIATGQTATDISYNAGNSWQAFDEKPNLALTQETQGFFTLASDNDIFIGAGQNGKVGVLSIKRD